VSAVICIVMIVSLSLPCYELMSTKNRHMAKRFHKMVVHITPFQRCKDVEEIRMVSPPEKQELQKINGFIENISCSTADAKAHTTPILQCLSGNVLRLIHD